MHHSKYVLVVAALLALGLSTRRPAAAQEIWTWGANYWGELGDGTTMQSSIPSQLVAPTHMLAVAAGHHHSLALKQDGTVWAWGNNDSGQLGDGTTTERHAPQQVPGLTNIVAISTSGGQSLALASDGTVLAWGGTFGLSPMTVQYLTKVVAISAGYRHSLALKSDGTVWAWGANDWGMLGNGTTTDSDVPVKVQDLTGVVAVAAGADFSLALTSSGYVFAWGYNAVGECGNGMTTPHYTPTYVDGMTNVVAIAAGFGHGLALKSDHTVWAWGWNSEGQLGDGTTTDRLSPVQVDFYTFDVFAIRAGSQHSLAVLQDGTLWAWGINDTGQLGSSGPGAIRPSRVPSLTHVGAFAGGQWHSLAVTWSKIPTRLTMSNVTTGIGQSAALKATLRRSDTGAAIAGQTIQFSIDGSPVGTGTTNSSGVASASYAAPESLSLGNHALTATLTENGTYYGGSASATLKVAKGKVSIGVAAVTGTAGSSKVLTATLKNLTGNPMAGRSLTFKVTIGGSTTTVGTAATSSSGVASVDYTIPGATPVGKYSISVSFSGDSLYLSGTGKGTLTVK